MRDGTLAARHLAERITIEQTQKRLRAETEQVDARVYAQTAAGRRHLRGILASARAGSTSGAIRCSRCWIASGTLRRVPRSTR